MVVNDNEGGIKVDGKVRRDAKYPAGLMGNRSFVQFFYIILSSGFQHSLASIFFSPIINALTDSLVRRYLH